VVHRSLKPLLNYEEAIEDKETWESAERQRRLLHALLQDKAALAKFVRIQLAYRFQDLTLEVITPQLDPDEGSEDPEVAILLPMIERMSPEDGASFASLMERDDCIIDLLTECFILKLERLTISEVSR
jgi:chemotaxis regulatin CheY-phosphate phosphatase CheZ